MKLVKESKVKENSYEKSYEKSVKYYANFRKSMSKFSKLKQWKFAIECANVVYWTTPLNGYFIRISVKRHDYDCYILEVGYGDSEHYIHTIVVKNIFPVNNGGFQSFKTSILSWLLVNSSVANFRLDALINLNKKEIKKCPIVKAVNNIENCLECQKIY